MLPSYILGTTFGSLFLNTFVSLPLRMQEDACTYLPFEDHFQLAILAESPSPTHDKSLEAHFVRLHDSTGPDGYNNLVGHPTASRKFWAMLD